MLDASAPDSPDRHPTPTAICAVIVTYHPDAGFPARADKVLGQVGGAIVIDNHSDSQARQMLRQWAASHPSVELVENAENRGIAAALNQGARLAIERGFGWMLSMDQDSEVEPFMVGQLLQAYGNCPFHERVRWISAGFRLSGDAAAEAETDLSFVEARTCNTSGALLCLATFAQLGTFREDYFIDSVDHEYCLRLRSARYRIIQTTRPLMVHPIGRPVRRRFCGLNCLSLNHPPLRRYYRTRNRLRTVAIYWRREPMWSGRELCDIVREAAMIAFFEEQKFAKLREMLRGVWHGLRGRMPKPRLDP